MTIRATLLGIGAILCFAAARCWVRAGGDRRLAREGALFLLLAAPFLIAGVFFTNSSYTPDQLIPTPPPEPVVVVATPRPAATPAARPEALTYAEAVLVAQHAAVARYPDLGRAGSDFNARFLVAYRRLRAVDPDYFTDPEWPLHLADDVAQNPPDP